MRRQLLLNINTNASIFSFQLRSAISNIPNDGTNHEFCHAQMLCVGSACTPHQRHQHRVFDRGSSNVLTQDFNRTALYACNVLMRGNAACTSHVETGSTELANYVLCGALVREPWYLPMGSEPSGALCSFTVPGHSGLLFRTFF
jgi:hypothetical protein